MTVEEFYKFAAEQAAKSPCKEKEISKPTLKEKQKQVIDNSHPKHTHYHRIREVAKLVSDSQQMEIGQNRLYKRMREWGLIIPNTTEPYQKSVSAGYLVLMSKVVPTQYGDRVVTWTKVTDKGVAYIINRLKTEEGVTD